MRASLALRASIASFRRHTSMAAARISPRKLDLLVGLGCRQAACNSPLTMRKLV